MQKMHMKLLIFLGVAILFSALFMRMAVIPANASLRVNTLTSASPHVDVIILPTVESPREVQSLAYPFSSLAIFTWKNMIVRTFQADELKVIQLSQAACYACHLDTKINCLYNIQPYAVSSCAAFHRGSTGLDQANRFTHNIVSCTSCHAGSELGFAWQASME